MNLKEKLLEIARKECIESNVELYIGKGKSVRYTRNILVNGFFDFDVPPSKKPRLCCAIGKPNWELILIHELCHLRQWKEEPQVWLDYLKISGNIIDQAVSGKKINEDRLTKESRITLLMELDCDRRAHQSLRELGYSKNKLSEYVQKANAYALFYLYIAEHKKWYKIGKEPYNIEKVWSKFPKTFNIDIDAEYKKLSHLFDLCI